MVASDQDLVQLVQEEHRRPSGRVPGKGRDRIITERNLLQLHVWQQGQNGDPMATQALKERGQHLALAAAQGP